MQKWKIIIYINIDIIQIEDQFRGQYRSISNIEKEEKLTIKLIDYIGNRSNYFYGDKFTFIVIFRRKRRGKCRL